MTPREQELARQLESCQQELAAARRENELLRQKIDLLVRRVFGSSSERLNRAQLDCCYNCRSLSSSNPCRHPKSNCACRFHALNARRVCRRTCPSLKK